MLTRDFLSAGKSFKGISTYSTAIRQSFRWIACLCQRSHLKTDSSFREDSLRSRRSSANLEIAHGCPLLFLWVPTATKAWVVLRKFDGHVVPHTWYLANSSWHRCLSFHSLVGWQEHQVPQLSVLCPSLWLWYNKCIFKDIFQLDVRLHPLLQKSTHQQNCLITIAITPESNH